MESILITPKDKTERNLLHSLLIKLGIPNKILSEEELEDAGLAFLMTSVDRTKKVSRTEIMKKLKP